MVPGTRQRSVEYTSSILLTRMKAYIEYCHSLLEISLVSMNASLHSSSVQVVSANMPDGQAVDVDRDAVQLACAVLEGISKNCQMVYVFTCQMI